MPTTHTDSQIVEYNEDGSRTETTVITYTPMTPAQTAKAWGTLIGVCVLPLAPLVGIAVYERYEEHRAEKKARKLAKKSEEKD